MEEQNTPKTPKRTDAPVFREIGVTGLKETSGHIYEEFVPKLQWPQAGDIYQEMSSNDPVITAIFLCARQLIRNVSWDVKPASQSPEDLRAAEFLKSCMHDMSMTWSNFISEISSYFTYGFSYHETVYKKRMGSNKDPHFNSKFDDGYIGWRKIPGRAQTSMHSWVMDDEGGLQGMKQYTSKGIVTIPIGRSLLFRTTAERNNPEGKSFLRGAYRPWYFKKHIEEIEGIGIERDLAGLPVITAPEEVDIFDKENPQAIEAKTAALSLVTSIRRDRNEGVVLPHGWDLVLLSSQSSRQFDTNDIINRYDQRIAITILADIVMLGADKVGSFALAKTKQSMLAASLDAQLTDICDVLNNYAVPRLFALNPFNLKVLPQIVCGSVVTPDLKDLGDYIKALAGSKMPLFPDVNLENYLRVAAGLPEAPDDEATRSQQMANAQEKDKGNKSEKGEKKDE